MSNWKKLYLTTALLGGVLLLVYGQQIEDWLNLRQSAQEAMRSATVQVAARYAGGGILAAASQTGFTAGLVSATPWDERDVQILLDALEEQGIKHVRLRDGQWALLGLGWMGAVRMKGGLITLNLGDEQPLEPVYVPEGTCILWWPAQRMPGEWASSDMLATSKLGGEPDFEGGSVQARAAGRKLLAVLSRMAR